MVKIPPAFASIEEYDLFHKHIHGKTIREKLLSDADNAIAWGVPDRECRGYSREELTNIISRLKWYIIDYVP